MSANTNKKQVAIVTGASSGIGLDITRALLEHGSPAQRSVHAGAKKANSYQYGIKSMA